MRTCCMDQNVSRSGRTRLSDDHWMAIFIASLTVALLGGGLLVLEHTLAHHYAVTAAEADGRDLCVLLDGHGINVNRAFVDAGEPCPASDGWHTAERTANGDLVVPTDMRLVVLFATMLLSGSPMAAIAAGKYLSDA